MSTVVPLLTPAQRAGLPERAREVIEYRKSGLSLNHILGCPLHAGQSRRSWAANDAGHPKALAAAECLEEP